MPTTPGWFYAQNSLARRTRVNINYIQCRMYVEIYTLASKHIHWYIGVSSTMPTTPGWFSSQNSLARRMRGAPSQRSRRLRALFEMGALVEPHGSMPPLVRDTTRHAGECVRPSHANTERGRPLLVFEYCCILGMKIMGSLSFELCLGLPNTALFCGRNYNKLLWMSIWFYTWDALGNSNLIRVCVLLVRVYAMFCESVNTALGLPTSQYAHCLPWRYRCSFQSVIIPLWLKLNRYLPLAYVSQSACAAHICIYIYLHTHTSKQTQATSPKIHPRSLSYTHSLTLTYTHWPSVTNDVLSRKPETPGGV